jgi:hypothetical protein
MFELFYKPPADPTKESALVRKMATLGGRLDCARCHPVRVAVAFQFEDLAAAQYAAATLREQGEHIEGPGDYGA